MLAALFMMIATTVGGFSYHVATLFDRSKPVKTTPPEYEPVWKERIEAIVASSRRDADFSRFMRQQALRLQQEYYRGYGADQATYEAFDHAGWLEVGEAVIAASPDLVSVSMGAGFYQADMAHPNQQGSRTFIWSRRLHRPLKQADVFAVPPDRALRRLALAKFDNRDELQHPDDPDGISLEWDRASIGPDGITWSFQPYELGGYLSGGSATIGWPALKPYLRHKLPFEIDAIRTAPPES